MITSKLIGGLGNQMFQISAAYALSMDVNDDYCFDFNTCHTPAQGNVSTKYKDNIFLNVKNSNLSKHSFTNYYKEPKFSYKELPKTKNTYLHGYFQSEKYFSNYKDEIKKLFNFDVNKKIELQKHLSKFDEITAIHVRRGDYLKKPNYHPTCTIEYYKKAINVIGKESDFIFVSDDINWCKENFKGKNIHYSPFTNELDDLYLIMLCDNQIIGNSSFSWWGGYLCEYHNNKVIAPSTWFGPNGPQDTQDIYLPKWIKI